MKNPPVLEFTSFITADGIEYSFDKNDRFLMTEEGLGLPPIAYITQKAPFQHGETIIDFRLEPRIIQLLIRQDSCSRQKFWENRALLLDMVRPNRYVGNDLKFGKLRKVFEDGSMRDITVTIDQGPAFTARSLSKWDEWGFTESLRFIAHDPIFFDPILKSILLRNLVDPEASENWELPWSFPMQFGATSYSLTSSAKYKGTWRSYPTIFIQGPMVGIEIQNVSTGEKIALDYTLISGESVTIFLQPGNKKVENNLGVNLIGTVTEDSNLSTFHIAPNPEVPDGINEFILSVTGTDANSYLLITYEERYIGI